MNSSFSKKDIITTIKNFEFSFKNQSIVPIQDLRERLIKNIELVSNRPQVLTKHDKELSKDLTFTSQFCKNNPSVFFTRADKGNLTVCLNKEDYKTKMKLLLNDTKTYKIRKRNPLQSLQSKVHNILSQFNDNNYLEFKYNNDSVTQSNTVLPKAYALPKIHKVDISLRPIISTINSPTNFLSKIIDKELKKCIKKPSSHINNSFELKVKLDSLTISSGYSLVSLDVSPLFTNISTELVLIVLINAFIEFI